MLFSFFFSSPASFPPLPLSLPLSLSFVLPLWRPLDLTHFALAFLPFIWLCHLFCHTGPLCQTLSPLARWLSSWFLSSYQFVCQVGTGDAAGCGLTSLCHYCSNSHQVCLRRWPLSLRLLSRATWTNGKSSRLEMVPIRFTLYCTVCLLFQAVSLVMHLHWLT